MKPTTKESERIVFTDVDGTIMYGENEPVEDIVCQIKEDKEAGAYIVVWSIGGEEYARINFKNIFGFEADQAFGKLQCLVELKKMSCPDKIYDDEVSFVKSAAKKFGWKGYKLISPTQFVD